MNVTREQARAMVDSVLSTLYERRPFKWDLGKMEGNEPELWAEMMTVMEDAAIKTAAAWGAP